MIKINLLAEKKPARAKTPSAPRLEGPGGSRNVLLAGIVVVGFVIGGIWWWIRDSELKSVKNRIEAADKELARLVEVRKKVDDVKKQNELLERKLRLITELKKKQSVPVQILDQVSRSLPDFVWLDSMSAVQNQINISGKATTYTAVSNFYNNLSSSGHFADLILGKTSESPEGVAFSLVCKFASPKETSQQPQG